MTNAANTDRKPSPRKLSCARCGTEFGCTLGGPCWCSDEAFQLPMDAAGEGVDCLCPDCLRALARELAERRVAG